MAYPSAGVGDHRGDPFVHCGCSTGVRRWRHGHRPGFLRVALGRPQVGPTRRAAGGRSGHGLMSLGPGRVAARGQGVGVEGPLFDPSVERPAPRRRGTVTVTSGNTSMSLLAYTSSDCLRRSNDYDFCQWLNAGWKIR